MIMFSREITKILCYWQLYIDLVKGIPRIKKVIKGPWHPWNKMLIEKCLTLKNIVMWQPLAGTVQHVQYSIFVISLLLVFFFPSPHLEWVLIFDQLYICGHLGFETKHRRVRSEMYCKVSRGEIVEAVYQHCTKSIYLSLSLAICSFCTLSKY